MRIGHTCYEHRTYLLCASDISCGLKKLLTVLPKNLLDIHRSEHIRRTECSIFAGLCQIRQRLVTSSFQTSKAIRSARKELPYDVFHQDFILSFIRIILVPSLGFHHALPYAFSGRAIICRDMSQFIAFSHQAL